MRRQGFTLVRRLQQAEDVARQLRSDPALRSEARYSQSGDEGAGDQRRGVVVGEGSIAEAPSVRVLHYEA